jgi:hypothetical protein
MKFRECKNQGKNKAKLDRGSLLIVFQTFNGPTVNKTLRVTNKNNIASRDDNRTIIFASQI